MVLLLAGELGGALWDYCLKLSVERNGKRAKLCPKKSPLEQGEEESNSKGVKTLLCRAACVQPSPRRCKEVAVASCHR